MEKDKKVFIDLKYVNASVLIAKIGNIKIPAYSLIGLIIFMVIQNRFSLVLVFIIFFLATYFETKQENLRTVDYKIAYIFKNRMVLASKNSLIREKLNFSKKNYL
jgi:hypothetical protein